MLYLLNLMFDFIILIMHVMKFSEFINKASYNLTLFILIVHVLAQSTYWILILKTKLYFVYTNPHTVMFNSCEWISSLVVL